MSCSFPYTVKQKGVVARVGFGKITCSEKEIDDIRYMHFTIHRSPTKDVALYLDSRLWSDQNTLLSVWSAIDAAEQVTPCRDQCYITMEPLGLKIAGDSLGLATFVALLGYVPSDVFLFTGFIQHFGAKEGKKDLLDLPIEGIDSAGEKCQGCFLKKKKLVLSVRCQMDQKLKDEFSDTLIWVDTVRDVLNILS